MAKPVTRGGIVWGYGAQALNIGAGLLLLPLIVHFLAPADVGLWFVFITFAGLAQLLEFGFQPTLARNASYVFSGARQLSKVGLPDETAHGAEVDIRLLQRLISTSRNIYRIVAVIAATVMLLGGTLYITTLLTPAQDTRTSVLAWLMFSSGHILTFYFGYLNGFLQGRGDVTQANKVTVINRGAFIILSCVFIIPGYGLLGLGAASMLSSAIGRFFAYHYFASDATSRLAAKLKNEPDSPNLFATLWHNASRLGAVQLGAFLIQRGNILIASSFLGLEAAASYGLTVTVLMALSAVAGAVCQIQVPHLSALQMKGDRVTLTKVYDKIVLLAWSVFLLGLVFVALYGNLLLAIAAKQIKLLPLDLTILLGCILLLELNHSIAATFLTTMNQVPFVSAAIVSGIGVCILSMLLIQPFGFYGLILAQGAVQLAYNNWKWPLAVRGHLGRQSLLPSFIAIRLLKKKKY